MAKYTPGPWEDKGPAHSNYHHYIAEKDRPSFGICEVFATNGEWTDRSEANARLIAVAPELLEVCKETLNYMIAHYTGGEMRTKLTDVIAKAE